MNNKDKILVTFDSNNRSSGNISAPIFMLDNSIKRVRKIYLTKLMILSNYYAFNDGNNSLGTINSTTVSISADTYTTATLASTIQTALRATGGGFASATCTFNTSTKKFTIESGSVATFDLDYTKDLVQIIGFSSNKSSVTSATSDYAVNETSFKIVSSNKSFIITRSAVDYTFNISNGNYTGNSIATELQTQIAATLTDITVEYLNNSNKLKFSGTSSFTVKSTGTASTYLGFSSNVASSSNVVTSEYGINIYGFTSVLVKSKTLADARLTNPTATDVIYETILDNVSGEILIDSPQQPYEITLAKQKGYTLSSIDFRLSDENGRYLNIGRNAQFKLFMVIEIA